MGYNPKQESERKDCEVGKFYVMPNGDLIFFRKDNKYSCKFIKDPKEEIFKVQHDPLSTSEILSTQDLRIASDEDISAFGKRIRDAIGFAELDQNEQVRINNLFPQEKTE